MENTPKAANKRKNVFIEKDFQTRFILKFCALVVIAGLLTIGILYFLSRESETVSFVNSRIVVLTTADFILPLLIQTSLIVIVMVSLATIVLTLFVSHKIAGPLYRFKKVLNSLEDGDFSSDFHIRHLDQLQGLADTFNSMIRKLRQELHRLRFDFLTLKDRLDNISEQEVSEEKRQTFAEVKRISEELNKMVNYFKT